MLAFQDFVPAEIKPGGFLRPAVSETIEACLERVNAWIQANRVDVLNVETLLLPNLSDPNADTSLGTSGETSSTWFQVVRVWFRQ